MPVASDGQVCLPDSQVVHDADILALYRPVEELSAGLGAVYYSAPPSSAAVSQVQSQFYSEGRAFIALLKRIVEVGSKTYEDREQPSNASCYASSVISSELRRALFLPSTVVPLRDGGIGIIFKQRTRRAELEALNTGEIYLTMYDLDGPIHVKRFDSANVDQNAPEIVDQLRAFISAT